jgi:predicted transcriptional regulator
MTAPRDHPLSNPTRPDTAGARLPALTPAGRELMEVLWSASRSPTTRQLQDAIARRFPHRAGRKIQTVSTLLAELMAQDWVAGEKRGGTRWVYRPAVSRGEGLKQIARWVVEGFVREPEDRLCLIREGLRMVGYAPADSPEALVDHAGRQAKGAAPQPLSDTTVR